MKDELGFMEEIKQRLNNIINLCGTENVQDRALELDEEYEEYKQEYKKLIIALVQLVKAQGKRLKKDVFLKYLPDEEFWEDVLSEVKEDTEDYFIVLPYTTLPEAERCNLLKKGFEILLLEREEVSFFADSVSQKSEIVKAIYRILIMSEYAIVLSSMSKRRYEKMLFERCSVEKKDLDMLWEMFHENWDNIEKYALAKQIMNLSRRVYHLSERIDELENMMLYSDIENQD